MSNEKTKYIPWYPFEEVKKWFDIEDFNQKIGSLVIYLTQRDAEKKTELRITFTSYVIISWIMNETYSMKQDVYLSDYFENNIPIGPLYMVENSDYMNFLSEESSTLTNVLGFKHYYIADSEWRFEVACQFPPTIELFIEGQLVKQA